MGENHLGKLKCECGSGDLGTRGSATGFLTNPNLSEFRAATTTTYISADLWMSRERNGNASVLQN